MFCYVVLSSELFLLGLTLMANPLICSCVRRCDKRSKPPIAEQRSEAQRPEGCQDWRGISGPGVFSPVFCSPNENNAPFYS